MRERLDLLEERLELLSRQLEASDLTVGGIRPRSLFIMFSLASVISNLSTCSTEISTDPECRCLSGSGRSGCPVARTLDLAEAPWREPTGLGALTGRRDLEGFRRNERRTREAFLGALFRLR